MNIYLIWTIDLLAIGFFGWLAYLKHGKKTIEIMISTMLVYFVANFKKYSDLMPYIIGIIIFYLVGCAVAGAVVGYRQDMHKN